jgi:hypothetical protein
MMIISERPPPPFTCPVTVAQGLNLNITVAPSQGLNLKSPASETSSGNAAQPEPECQCSDMFHSGNFERRDVTSSKCRGRSESLLNAGVRCSRQGPRHRAATGRIRAGAAEPAAAVRTAPEVSRRLVRRPRRPGPRLSPMALEVQVVAVARGGPGSPA